MSWLGVYRLALRVLPVGLRTKHGPAMEALFARELERARRRGRRWTVFVGVASCLDAVRRGLHERGRLSRLAGRKGRRDVGVAGGWSMEGLWRDLAYSLRSLSRTPTFTIVVVLSLALGVGANGAIFSVLDAVLFRPLPFPDADRVVNLAWDGGGYLQSGLTPLRFEYWRENARTLDAATWRASLGRVEEGGEVRAVRALRVSRGFLEVIGHAPAIGRYFTDSEYGVGGPRVAVVSSGFGERHFGAAVDVVGRTIRLDGEPYGVIGVLPEAFEFPYVDGDPGAGQDVEVVVPLALVLDPDDEGANWPAIARLRDGFSRAEAQAEVVALRAPFQAAHPHQVYEGERGMTLATFAELYVGPTTRALWILMGAVAFVLLIVCANVANLFLARTLRRRGEVALRSALGATRGHIARLVLLESAWVAVAAGALGLLVARWGVGVLLALTPAEVPRMEEIGVDGRVALFTFAVALGTGLLFGGAVAWSAARMRLAETLKEGMRGGAGGGSRARQGLLVAQSALSMVLLVGAGLFAMTLIGLTRVDAGFEADGLVAVRLPFKPAGYETSGDVWAFQRRVIESVGGTAAASSIAGATNLPLERGINFPMSIGGRPDDFEGAVEWRAVTPGYFRTLGVPLLEGRAFEMTDAEGGPPIAIVNEAFARRYFPGQSALGETIEIGRFRGDYIDPSLEGPGARIVGVVADIREVSLRAQPRRTVYVPQSQAHSRISAVLGTMPVFIARTSGGGDVARMLVEVVRSAGPGLPEPDVLPLDDVVAASLARERFGATLLAGFAGLALCLTAFGIYGVLVYAVRQRRREIGIRMALGAGRPDVARLVMAHGIGPVLAGLLLGLAASLALSRVVAGYLWGVTPSDPATLGSVAVVLLGVALVASWLPAREAVRLDPARTLHGD